MRRSIIHALSNHPLVAFSFWWYIKRKRSLVTYADPAIAEAAIEQLNNVELGGRPIHIRLDRKEVEASGGFPGKLTIQYTSVSATALPVRTFLWGFPLIVAEVHHVTV